MTRTVTAVLIATCVTCAWPLTVAADSLQSSGRALQHSVNAIGYAIAGGAQLVSGAAAIPLGFGGAIGQLSGELSEELLNAANAPIGTPLPITDDVVTIGPPPSAAVGGQAGGAP